MISRSLGNACEFNESGVGSTYWDGTTMTEIITIAQQKGGSGKTTLAANIAIANLLLGRKVAILDTDPQGSLGRWFMARCDRLGEDNTGLRFRTASAWGARYEARDLAKENDLVIIDTPPKMGVDGRPAIETANLVIVPVTPSKVDLWATEPTLELAAAERKPALLVLNRASARTRLTGEAAENMAKFGVGSASTTIGNRILFAEAMGTGLGVQEMRASSPAADEVARLANEISGSLRRTDLAA